MAQFKTYGHRKTLERTTVEISAAINCASMQALGLLASSCFHRFTPLAPWQYVHPENRSSRYLSSEVMMFAGRPAASKKAFYTAILQNLLIDRDIQPIEIELTILENPLSDWLIRGLPGDELAVEYNFNHVAEYTA